MDKNTIVDLKYILKRIQKIRNRTNNFNIQLTDKYSLKQYRKLSKELSELLSCKINEELLKNEDLAKLQHEIMINKENWYE